MKNHPRETTLALYAGGDLSGWERLSVGVHVFGCAACAETVRDFDAVQNGLKETQEQMPAGLNWERLADEMAGNIRVGLEAGACVEPARSRRRFGSSWLERLNQIEGFDSWSRWKQGLVFGLVGMLFVTGALWLNLPAAQSEKLQATARGLFRGRNTIERGVVFEATSAGIELREGGRAYWTALHPQANVKPISLTADLNGSMRARYVDSEGQVTISNVYAE